MRKNIEELLNSDITGYKIAKTIGIGESVISNLRNGKRELGNISLKNAELLNDFKEKYDIYVNLKEIKLPKDEKIKFISYKFTNYSTISKNKTGNGYCVTFETVKKVKVEDRELYEIEYKYADGIKIINDYNIDEIKQQILDKEQSEGILHVKSFKEAIAYLTMKFNLHTLEQLIKNK